MTPPHYAVKLLLARNEEEIRALERRLLWTAGHDDRLALSNKLADLYVKHGDLKAFLSRREEQPK